MRDVGYFPRPPWGLGDGVGIGAAQHDFGDAVTKPLPNIRQSLLSTGILDRIVQQRFAVIPDKDFGSGRIGNQHELFSPTTPKEVHVIRDLEKTGQPVIFYVVGLSTIKKIPTGQNDVYPVQGPIRMTRDDLASIVWVDKDRSRQSDTGGPVWQTKRPLQPLLPTEEELTALAGTAVEELGKNGPGLHYETEHWKVVATPVRATNKACLNCHYAPVKLGDPLGIALYLSQQPRN